MIHQLLPAGSRRFMSLIACRFMNEQYKMEISLRAQHVSLMLNISNTGGKWVYLEPKFDVLSRAIGRSNGSERCE